MEAVVRPALARWGCGRCDWERLAKLLWDMWSIRRHIFRTPPAGEFLPNLLLPVATGRGQPVARGLAGPVLSRDRDGPARIG